MMNIKGIFAVSLIAMVAMVAGAHTSNAVAAIASQGYVDQQIGTKVSTTQGSAAANKAVITNASGNIITGTISSAMITDGTITNADIAANAAIDQSKISGLTTALKGKANTADLGDLATLDAVGSAQITDGSVATADIANKAVTEAKLSDTVNASLDKADTALQAADLADYATKSEIPTVNNGQLTINVNGTSHSFTANQAGGTTVDIDIPDEVDFSGLSGSTTGSGNVVTSVTQTDGKVSATKGITAEETKNKVKSVRAVASATDTAYPSEKAVATALETKVNTSALSGYATIKALDAVEGKADAAQSAADAAASAAATAQSTANAKVSTAQGSAAANKAVITNASGTITTGQIASGMIANDAVTSAKIADGTITNADIAANAAIETSKVDFSGLSGSTTGGGNVVTSVTQENGKVSAFKGITAEVASNRVTSANFDSNTSNDTKYPTVKAVADAIADAVPTASDILTATTVTSQGTGAVLTGVSVEDGKVTLQKGNVQIPSGGQNATSYVSIWVE